MIRKLIALITAFTIIFSLTSCSNSKDAGGDGVIEPVSKDGKLEITILVSSIDYNILSDTVFLADYIAKFKKDFGVSIKFEKIAVDNSPRITLEENADYLKKLLVKLTPKDGPELIFTQHMSIEPLIKQQAVVDLRGKVTNIDKIYESLLSDKVYYAPLGVAYIGMKINRETLAELKLDEPGLNWMPRDYYAAKDKWISNNKIMLNGYEYGEAFRRFIDLKSLYKPEEKKITLNTPEVIQKINDLRSYIFEGNYKLIESYKYKNYYNMLYEDRSEEWNNSFQNYLNNIKNGQFYGGPINNLFRAENLQNYIEKYAIVKFPDEVSNGVTLDSYGFIVNKNGKNQDLAYEFINGLLSNEVQMDMFKSETEYYPVNKEIEADILKLESEKQFDPKATQLKAFALQELKGGKYKLWTTENTDIWELEGAIKKDMSKLILADEPYSDEQLQVELKKLEDKYNIYLSE